jgi:hypothetical protein
MRRYYAMPIAYAVIKPVLLWIVSFLPAIILCSWRTSPILRWKSTFSTWLVVAAFTSGFVLVATDHWFAPEPDLKRNFIRILALNRALWLAPALVSIVKLPLDRRVKRFMKVTTFAYLVASSVTAITIPGLNSPATMLSNILLLLTQACVLFGVLGSFIVAARFHFVDVFVRWSTRITLLGVLALIGSLSFVYAGSATKTGAPPFGLLACSIEFVLLLLLGITLAERCERWVESHVLQRLDLKAEAVRLRNELFSIEDKESVFPFIETKLKQLLEVREVRIVSRSSVPPQLLALENATNSHRCRSARLGKSMSWSLYRHPAGNERK